jgi:Glycosyl hydrolase family 12
MWAIELHGWQRMKEAAHQLATDGNRAPLDCKSNFNCRRNGVRSLRQSMEAVAIALLATAILTTSAAEAVFVTSDPNGGWPEGGYYVHNNMWNSASYQPCTSTLYAWSHDKWHVITKMNNSKGDGAVKTYPNVHRDYRNVPVGSFDSITSTFAETSPRIGIYNVAYDLWINGIAKPGCTEIMIWTENFNQVPGGRYVEDAIFHGRTYKVYKRSNSGYIAFVASSNFTSGTVNLLDILRWVVAKGWLADNATLNQICYGVEMVSTDDTEATFQVTAFSIDAKQKRAAVAP